LVYLQIGFYQADEVTQNLKTMGKNTLILTCLAMASIVFYACSDSAGSKADAAKTTDSTSSVKDSSTGNHLAATIYTCRMHPEVTSDKPGKCPVCGMDLVEKVHVMRDSTAKDIKMDGMSH
jgi:hypothetical protein